MAFPRLNSRIADMVSEYEESMASLKMYFPEGEVDLLIAPRFLQSRLDVLMRRLERLKGVYSVEVRQLIVLKKRPGGESVGSF